MFMYKLKNKIPFLMLNFPKLMQQPIEPFQAVVHDFIIIFSVHTDNLFRICFIKMLFFENSESFLTSETASSVAWNFKNADFVPCFKQPWSPILIG